MPDICIFYAHEDERWVNKLVTELSKYWDIWWDRVLSAGKWPHQVEEAISNSLCAIPIWSKTSVDPKRIIVNEAKHAQDIGLTILHIKIDDVSLPLPFNLDITKDNMIGWNGDPSDENFKELFEELENIVGPPNQKYEGSRPQTIMLNEIAVELPCFLRSISSFETQLDPVAALKILSLMPDSDAVLVSAYDTFLPQEADKNLVEYHNELINLLKTLKERERLIILDSGNYEASRKGELDKWTKNEFLSTIDKTPFSYAFCFDNLEPPEDAKTIVSDVVSRVNSNGIKNVLPIVHVPRNKDGRHKRELLPAILYNIAIQINPKIIAIPERELGDGIFKRAKIVKQIRKELNRLGRYQPIHILGTGNPISIAILAAAGADFFDGLEWCRTVVDRHTGLLYHHQQYDFFQNQTKTISRFNFVRDIADNKDIDITLKMALHNLDFFHEWMEEIQHNIENERISEMLACYLPKHTYMDIRGQLSEILEP